MDLKYGQIKLNKAIIKGTVIDPNETYLVIPTIKKNNIVPMIARNKLIEAIIPKSVAAPFPPLNLKYIGNMWPMITKSKINCGIKPLKDSFLSCIRPNAKPSQKLLEVSKIKTSNPNLKPWTLIALVAPALPEPIFLMSSFLELNFVRIIEKFIEPSK